MGEIEGILMLNEVLSPYSLEYGISFDERGKQEYLEKTSETQ